MALSIINGSNWLNTAATNIADYPFGSYLTLGNLSSEIWNDVNYDKS